MSESRKQVEPFEGWVALIHWDKGCPYEFGMFADRSVMVCLDRSEAVSWAEQLRNYYHKRTRVVRATVTIHETGVDSDDKET